MKIKEEDVSHVVVLVTVDKKDEALKISEAVVKEGLAACCNVVEGVSSIFTWEGDLDKAAECLMIIKTRADLFEKLKQKVEQLHPYDVPEIIAMPVVAGNKAYLEWIDKVVGSD